MNDTRTTDREAAMSRQVLLTIERPDGKVETVDLYPQMQGMTDELCERIRRDTKAAGRGTVLGYEVIDADTRTDAEKAYGEVSRLDAKAEWTGSVVARVAADKALADWRNAYPTDADAMDARAKSDVRHADRNAVLEGRD